AHVFAALLLSGNQPATPVFYTLSLHDALPIFLREEPGRPDLPHHHVHRDSGVLLDAKLPLAGNVRGVARLEDLEDPHEDEEEDAQGDQHLHHREAVLAVGRGGAHQNSLAMMVVSLTLGGRPGTVTVTAAWRSVRL